MQPPHHVGVIASSVRGTMPAHLVRLDWMKPLGTAALPQR